MEQDSNTVRVLVVDDLFIVRQTLRCVLQPHPDIEVVGEASDGDEVVPYVGRFQPDVVIMDISMSKVDGVTATRMVKTQYPHVLVIGFSADLKDHNVWAMQQAGAFQVLRKEDAMEDLYGAIQRAVATIH